MSRPKVEYFELDDDFSRPCFLSNDLTKYQCGKSRAKKNFSQRAQRRQDIKEFEAYKKSIRLYPENKRYS